MCGESGPLTEDHTPPKGCYKPTQVEIQSLLRRLSNTAEGKRSRFSQNGVKYRTLCHRCNNTLLGATYDPEFISFVNHVAALFNSQIALPEVLSVPGQPQAILRSLLGHIYPPRELIDIPKAPRQRHSESTFWIAPFRCRFRCVSSTGPTLIVLM